MLAAVRAGTPWPLPRPRLLVARRSCVLWNQFERNCATFDRRFAGLFRSQFAARSVSASRSTAGKRARHRSRSAGSVPVIVPLAGSKRILVFGEGGRSEAGAALARCGGPAEEASSSLPRFLASSIPPFL